MIILKRLLYLWLHIAILLWFGGAAAITPPGLAQAWYLVVAGVAVVSAVSLEARWRRQDRGATMVRNECHQCAAPVADTGYCCHSCAQDAQNNLDFIADNAAELDTVIARLARTGRGVGVASADTRLPFDAEAAEAAAAIHRTITRWTRHVLDTRGMQLPLPPGPTIGPRCAAGLGCRHASCNAIRHGRTSVDPGGLAPMAAWLAGQTEWLRHRTDAADAFAQLHTAARDLRRCIDSHRQLVYRGPCYSVLPDGGDCLTDLYAAPGADFVTCRTCRTTHNSAHRREWLAGQIQDRLVNAAGIARLVSVLTDAPLSSSTVRSWIRRGRLVSRGYELDGTPTYRVGDALDLLAATQKAKAA